MRSLPWSVLIAIPGLACVSESRGAPVAAVRDTLPNGTVMVHYPRLPASPPAPLATDLAIGVAEGDPHLMFGDIRGIEASGDGTIYVLDYQTSEIRAYDAQGRYLRTLTRQGSGPGELRRANGIILVGDSALWIQDHGQWMMIAVDLNGEELTRFTMPVLSYGYVWSGIIDHRGRFWKEVIVSDEPRQYPPKDGLTEDHARGYLKSYDPRTETTDSIYVGDLTYRTLIARNNQGGYSYRAVPYTPRRISVVDPAGGFWQVSGTAYRIARLDEQGDTALVIEVAADPIPVTEQDRERASKGVGEESPEQQRLAQQIAGAMPEVKPWITGLVMDDVGRLWAQRTATDGEPAIYDVFRADGGYVGTVTLSFTPYFPIRIRHGRVYGAVRDSLDVPSVVRSEPLPVFPD
jgi:hypothetical protein